MKIELHFDYFEEDGAIVAVCRELQVSSFGDTLDEAEKSIREAVNMFLEGCEELGTLSEVLEESGFRRAKDKWVHRKPILTKKATLKRAASYA